MKRVMDKDEAVESVNRCIISVPGRFARTLIVPNWFFLYFLAQQELGKQNMAKSTCWKLIWFSRANGAYDMSEYMEKNILFHV